MGKMRVANIPIHHLVAELWAAPLTVMEAFRSGLVELQPEMKRDTADLWRATEQLLLCSTPALPVDEVVSLRDALWFRSPVGYRPTQAVPLHRFLRELSRQTLRPVGAELIPQLPEQLRPRADDSDVEGRLFFRWLSLALPVDLLVAAGEAPTGRVQLVQPVLDQSLRDDGFAESHLHIGAALEFPLLWVSLQHALAAPETAPAAFASPGAQMNEGRDQGPWLLRGLIARYLLAAFLFSARRGAEAGLAQALPGLCARVADRLGLVAAALSRGCLRDLFRGTRDSSERGHFVALQRIYADLTALRQRGGRTPRSVESVEAFALTDPLAAFFPIEAQAGSAEAGFVAAGLAYLEEHTDPLFARLFWQVQRLRVLFYRHVTQRPMTPGLQWFVRFFQRLRPARRSMGPIVLLQEAARLCGAGAGLRSLEVRTAPEDTVSGTRGLILQLEAGAKAVWARAPKLEIGLVLHFTKQRGDEAMAGRPAAFGQDFNADPGAKGNLGGGCRFTRFARRARQQAMTLERLLQSRPRSLALLRGIDICTDELGVPTWVLSPVLRQVREASRWASVVMDRSGSRLPPLRTTVHAGEDFIHLLGGLRRVDEALRYLPLEAGDRLGHALALGTDPIGWAAAAGRVPLTREERFFDLAWEWRFWLAERQEPPPGRMNFIEAELLQHGRALFAPFLSRRDRWLDRDMALAFVDALHDERLLRRWRFPEGVRSTPDRLGLRGRAEELLWSYLTDRRIYHISQQVVMVDAPPEGEALSSLQRELRRKVGRLGVTVEVNPSSNLLVGNLSDLKRHPLWRLRSPTHDGDAPPAALCLGSDDPLTFATSTRQEYQLVYDTLSQQGLSDVQIRGWLDAARRTGMQTRFTLPVKVTQKAMGVPRHRSGRER